MLVLVIEDDQDYGEIIAQTLRRESHEVVLVGTSQDAERFSQRKTPELAILDVILPDGSGLELCAQLRQRVPTLPIIFLSALDRSNDVMTGLNEGADDYMTKPFHPGELLARVRAVTRRSQVSETSTSASAPQLQAVGLEVDPGGQAAYYEGINLNCTRLEIDILAQLVGYPGQALSHEFLSEQIWGYKNVHDATLLKGHLSSLRRKLREAGGDSDVIRTVHGVGYAYTPV